MSAPNLFMVPLPNYLVNEVGKKKNLNKVLYEGLHPEVQNLTLLYTIFNRKITLSNTFTKETGTPFTYTVHLFLVGLFKIF